MREKFDITGMSRNRIIYDKLSYFFKKTIDKTEKYEYNIPVKQAECIRSHRIARAMW